MGTIDFKELYRKIVDQYELDPVSAEQLLLKILEELKNSGTAYQLPEGNFERLNECMEREEIPWQRSHQE